MDNTAAKQDQLISDPKSLVIAAIIVLAIYFVTLVAPMGWVSYVVGVPAFIINGLTALARANDLNHELDDSHWNVRRFGLALAGGASLMLIIGPVLDSFPSWRTVILCWGVALVWLTTKGQKPWWTWITGDWDRSVSIKEHVRRFVRSLFGKEE